MTDPPVMPYHAWACDVIMHVFITRALLRLERTMNLFGGMGGRGRGRGGEGRGGEGRGGEGREGWREGREGKQGRGGGRGGGGKGQ